VSVLLDARGLTKRFGGITAVRDMQLVIAEGEIISLIGPNGAGKTSCLNLLSRIFKPTSGSIIYRGDELLNAAPYSLPSLGIARTFQNLALFPSGTVVENILVGRHSLMKSTVLGSALFLPSVRREEIEHREAVEKIIDFLEIESIRNTKVGSLPYGLQKRVELGRALAVQPKLLLVDEMVSGMNLEETEDIARFLLDIRDEYGTSILMVEHDLGMVMGISDRVYVMNFGQLIATGAPAEVANDPAVIAAYMGKPIPA
jgi:branched-chain amino acid transport system ATP-binding protein